MRPSRGLRGPIVPDEFCRSKPYWSRPCLDCLAVRRRPIRSYPILPRRSDEPPFPSFPCLPFLSRQTIPIRSVPCLPVRSDPSDPPGPLRSMPSLPCLACPLASDPSLPSRPNRSDPFLDLPAEPVLFHQYPPILPRPSDPIRSATSHPILPKLLFRRLISHCRPRRLEHVDRLSHRGHEVDVMLRHVARATPKFELPECAGDQRKPRRRHA